MSKKLKKLTRSEFHNRSFNAYCHSYCFLSTLQLFNYLPCYGSVRLEVLNEKRTASVQMLKLAEKERDSLEVLISVLRFHRFAIELLNITDGVIFL